MEQNAILCPQIFRDLLKLNVLSEADLHNTVDGFFMTSKSIAALLLSTGVRILPRTNGADLPVQTFYDDWYLFALSQDQVCGLVKMREQEFDRNGPVPADGDTPGVTLSFIAFSAQLLHACLTDPNRQNQAALSAELERVTSTKGQSHHKALKDYFNTPKADAPYLIAELYCQKIAATACDGTVSVPVRYAQLHDKNSILSSAGRLSRFLEENNTAAGYPVCDHKNIYIRDPQHLSRYEQLAILATHTGNVSFHSFAAEIRFHALFLTPLAKIPIPFLWRSPYDSAIRADLSIDDKEFQGPTPYYRENSFMVRKQKQAHPEY